MGIISVLSYFNIFREKKILSRVKALIKIKQSEMLTNIYLIKKKKKKSYKVTHRKKKDLYRSEHPIFHDGLHWHLSHTLGTIFLVV